MTKRVWNSGPPPHVGWWNASWLKSDASWRWWNGVRWSRAVQDYCDVAEAGGCAAKPTGAVCQADILWTRYWPENARVARINPQTGKVTGKGPKP